MEEKKNVKGIIAVSAEDKLRNINVNQKFRSTVTDKKVTFPKGLGAAHPFDFEDMEKALKKIGIVSGNINKIKEAIVGDFTVSSDNENADSILKDFVKNTNFTSVLREWIKEGLTKGNGFMEIDLKNQRVKAVNANNMYVKRNNKGKVLQYNQWNGKQDFTNYDRTNKNKKIIPFTPERIAHLKLNKVANEPYGIGILYPNERIIEGLVGKEEDANKLISRKANAPLQVKIGKDDEVTDPEVINQFKSSLQYMNNSTNWVTDKFVDMEVIDYGPLGEALYRGIDHDLQMISAGMEIPAVLMGQANVPEGLAKVQLENWQRKIMSIRKEIESIIVNQIFKPLLSAQSGKTKKVKGFEQVESDGLAGDINFLWNLPGEEEKNKRVEQLNKIIQNPFMDEALRRGAQLEVARVLELEGLDEVLPLPEDAEADMEAEKKEQEEQEKPEKEDSVVKKKEKDIPQPEVPGAKPTAKAKQEKIIEKPIDKKLRENLTNNEAAEMTIREYVNITELEGFNYSDYLIKILQKLKVDKFEDLLAKNDLDIAQGLLPKNEIEKLRIVLREGFKKNKTIRQIEKEISETIPLKDRTKEVGDTTKVTAKAESRPNMIARTETVRLSNEGLKSLYEENNVKKYQYLAAIDDRTSEICESLNGRIFKLKDGQPGVNMPPMHVNCRSTIIGVVE